MTDNEIIKADELISKLHKYCFFSQMKMGELNTFTESDFDCLHNLIDTINRQKAEIERLSKIVVDLNANLSELVHCFTRMETLYKIKCKELDVVKSEARKELAVKIKNELISEAKKRKPCEECQRDMATVETLELIDRVLRSEVE